MNHINTQASIKDCPLAPRSKINVLTLPRLTQAVLLLASSLLLLPIMADTASVNQTMPGTTAINSITHTDQPDDSAIKLLPFSSDGCSAFPDGTLDQQHLWLSCCQLHDYAYWKGGSYDERASSDVALRQCVAAAGQPYIAELMLNGVRVGGTPYLPTPFRWGYGWPFLRGYKRLSEEEVKQVKSLSQNIHWPMPPSSTTAP